MKKILIIIFFLNPIAFAQQSELFQTVKYLSKFIASDYFNHLSEKCNDLSLVDTLFNRAVKFKNNDYSEALLSLTFATVPYKKVPILIPVLRIIVRYPLISANDSIFLIKNRNLPKDLYFDTPKDKFGDKDKLAHFFGSAFIAYNSSIFDLGNLIGYFVEVFEEEFKVQSKIDNRDLMTNRLGYLFGTTLKRNKDIQPSNAFLLRSLIYSDFYFP